MRWTSTLARPWVRSESGGQEGRRARWFFLAKTCQTVHTPVDLFNGVHKIVTQAVSYAFVGHPLCRCAIPCLD